MTPEQQRILLELLRERDELRRLHRLGPGRPAIPTWLAFGATAVLVTVGTVLEAIGDRFGDAVLTACCVPILLVWALGRPRR